MMIEKECGFILTKCVKTNSATQLSSEYQGILNLTV